MPITPVVLIGPSERLSLLSASLSTEADVVEFADTDTDKAVHAVTTERPSAVILERGFATSALGSAFIRRIRVDSDVGHTKILVGSHESDRTNLIPLPIEMIIPSSTQPRDEKSPEDFRGTRRTARVALRMGVLIHVDGDPATVIDMSRIGAQVLASQVLRPSQHVRVLVGAKPTSVRCSATIAWVQFELNGGNGGSYYRAGLEFFGADGDAVDAFCVAHQDPTSAE